MTYAVIVVLYIISLILCHILSKRYGYIKGYRDGYTNAYKKCEDILDNIYNRIASGDTGFMLKKPEARWDTTSFGS